MLPPRSLSCSSSTRLQHTRTRSRGTRRREGATIETTATACHPVVTATATEMAATNATAATKATAIADETGAADVDATGAADVCAVPQGTMGWAAAAFGDNAQARARSY